MLFEPPSDVVGVPAVDLAFIAEQEVAIEAREPSHRSCHPPGSGRPPPSGRGDPEPTRRASFQSHPIMGG